MLCAILRDEVGKYFPNHTKVAIGGFIILRFINPVIVSPDSFYSNFKSNFLNNDCSTENPLFF